MWTRRVSPASFGLSLMCFLLPWIDIRCNSPRGGLFSGQGTDLVIVSQSGLQMTYGGVSTTVNHRPLTAAQAEELERHKANRIRAMPAMILYGLCLVAGLGASLTFRDERRRFLCGTAASAIAVIVLVVQLANGFPLVENVPRRRGGNGWSYTIAFWLGLGSTFAALIGSVIGRDSVKMGSSAMAPRGADDVILEWLTHLRSRRGILGAKIVAASSVVILFALYVWPGFFRPLPQYGIAMSGYVDYMLSDEHIAGVKYGMSIEEVGAVLDVAQRGMEVPPFIANTQQARDGHRKVGDNNVQLIALSLQQIEKARQKEFWFRFCGTTRTLSVRILDGKVVEIRDSKEPARR